MNVSALFSSENIFSHWRSLIALWLLICAVNGMPSPTDKSSPWYKWLFGFTHLATAGVPRVIATLFPQFAKYLPGNGNSTPPAPDSPKPQGG